MSPMLYENSLYRFLVLLNLLLMVDGQETGLLYPSDRMVTEVWAYLGDGLETAAALLSRLAGGFSGCSFVGWT